MRMWKWLGLAGMVGAAVVGIAAGTARAKRNRRDFIDTNPDHLRERLHARLAEAELRDAAALDS